MAFNAGSVYATLGYEIDSAKLIAYEASLKNAAAQAEAAEKRTIASQQRVNASTSKMGAVAKNAAVLGVGALALGLAKGVGVAANFDAALSKTSALGGEYAKRLGEMRKAALDLGTSTGVGATKAAGAIEALAKGGLSATQILEGGLKGAIALAQSGQMDLAEAAETAANALNLFGLSGDQATHVADAFATAANATTADVSFFAQGLAQGGLAAKNAGLTFDETTLALEAMAKAGFKSGSDAGTSLKTALTQLSAPSKQAAEETKRLGLNFKDTEGSIKPLPAIAEMLRDKWGKLSDTQRLASASALVGQDGMRALLALYQTGGPTLEKFATGLQKQGTAAKSAADQTDNLAGAWQRTKAAAERLAITIGEPLQNPLKDFLNAFASGLNNIAVGDFGHAADKILSVFTTILRGAQALADGMAHLPVVGKIWEGVADEIDKIADSLDRARSKLRGDAVKIKIDADITGAIGALKKVQGTKIDKKVMKVIGDKTDADQKTRALIALHIPPKWAHILADNSAALAGISTVEGAMARLNNLRAVVRVEMAVGNLNPKIPTSLGLSKTRPRAAGHKTSGPEFALIGEGAGPEYVIPTESRYRGRALGLLMDAAQDLGVAGYKAGTKKKGKAPAKKRKPRWVPAREEYLHLSPEEFERREGDQDSYVKALSENAKEKVEKGPRKGKPTRKAMEAKGKLGRERAELSRLKANVRQAKRYADRIQKEEDLVNIAVGSMKTADTKDDQKGYDKALKSRTVHLGRKASLIKAALKFAPAGSKWRRTLEAALGQVTSDQADPQLSQAMQDAADARDAAADAADEAKLRKDQEAQDAADRLYDTGLTPEEQRQLEALETQESLAALTQGLEDDIAAAQAKDAFLEQMLGVARSDPARAGGVKDLADAVLQARQNVKALTTGSGSVDNADLQAQLDQRTRERDEARGTLQTERASFGVLNNAGDLGYGPTVVNNINTLHPGDSRTLDALAGATAAGFSQQPYRPSQRETVGP